MKKSAKLSHGHVKDSPGLRSTPVPVAIVASTPVAPIAIFPVLSVCDWMHTHLAAVEPARTTSVPAVVTVVTPCPMPVVVWLTAPIVLVPAGSALVIAVTAVTVPMFHVPAWVA